MKMLREVNSPYSGVVKEIFFEEGDMLDADDVPHDCGADQ